MPLAMRTPGWSTTAQLHAAGAPPKSQVSLHPGPPSDAARCQSRLCRLITSPAHGWRGWQLPRRRGGLGRRCCRAMQKVVGWTSRQTGRT